MNAAKQNLVKWSENFKEHLNQVLVLFWGYFFVIDLFYTRCLNAFNAFEFAISLFLFHLKLFQVIP